VRAAGVRVGTVSSVDVVNHDEARVTFSVDTKRAVYLSTRFAIRYLNLVGQRYVSLLPEPATRRSS